MELVEANECRHRCGLLGLRCLYEALALCGREDLAYHVITADGYPSYRQWFTAGATTLWEHWKQNRPNGDYASKNHHMYSDVLSYLVKSTLGIRHDRRTPEEAEFCLEPYFWTGLCAGLIRDRLRRIVGGPASGWENRYPAGNAVRKHPCGLSEQDFGDGNLYISDSRG